MQCRVGVRLAERLSDAASQGNVILFQQHGVIKADAMICSATHFHRVFFEQPKSGSGFARVANARVRSR